MIVYPTWPPRIRAKNSLLYFQFCLTKSLKSFNTHELVICFLARFNSVYVTLHCGDHNMTYTELNFL